MGNSLRCCIACVLPCGALDLIRIVHINGNVEEYTRPITAGEILDANPNHVLSKPCSQGVVRSIVIVSPDSELKRGSIYFLIPSSSLPDKNKTCNDSVQKSSKNKIKRKCRSIHDSSDSDYCMKDVNVIVPGKKSSSTSRRDRRTGRSGVWRPHLESISEDY